MKNLASNGMWITMDPFLAGDTNFNEFNYISATVSTALMVTLETEKLTASVRPNPLAQNQASLPNIEVPPPICMIWLPTFNI